MGQGREERRGRACRLVAHVVLYRQVPQTQYLTLKLCLLVRNVYCTTSDNTFFNLTCPPPPLQLTLPNLAGGWGMGEGVFRQICQSQRVWKGGWRRGAGRIRDPAIYFVVLIWLTLKDTAVATGLSGVFPCPNHGHWTQYICTVHNIQWLKSPIMICMI
jgi:hypothetical protein